MADARARFILTAEDRTKAATAAAQANFARLEASVRRVGAVLAGGFLIRGAARFASDTLKMAESIGDVAEKAGLTAEQLQVLRFAADQNGSSAGQLDKALSRLNASLGQAGREALGLEKTASPAGKALKALGIEVLDAGGNVRSTADLFPELIDRLAAVPNSAERAALAAQVFGKKIGPELAVLIQGGSASLKAFEAQLRATGGLLDNELVARSAALKDQFDAIGAAVKTNFQAGFLQGFLGEFRGIDELARDPEFVANVRRIGQSFGELLGTLVEQGPAALDLLQKMAKTVAIIAGARFGATLGSALGVPGQIAGAVVGGVGGALALDAITGEDEDGARQRQEARAREAIKLTRDIAAAAQQRLTAESGISQRLVALKADETARLTAELAKQKTAYDEATDAVRTALQQREQIEQEFADLTQKRGSQTAAQATLQSFAAQRALTAGDPKEALRLAREAADAVRDLQSSGDTGASLQLTARRIQQVAKDAAQAQLDQARQAQATAAQAIQHILDLAAQIKALPVGFDTEQAITDAQSLRAALEQALAANPIHIPVVLDSSAADQFAQTQIDKAIPPGRATGGYIPGHSPHARADNVLIRATAGEYVLPLGAVQRLTAKHGAGLLEQLRRGRLPGYADGGPVRQLLDGLAAPPRLAPLAAAGLANAPTTVINLTLPNGQTYTVRADTDTAAALQSDVRRQALKAGTRR